MFCWKCGAQNDHNGNFCAKCGANLTAAQNTNSAVPTATKAPAAKKSGKGLVIGIITLLIIAALAVAAYFIIPTLSGSDSDERDTHKSDRIDKDDEDLTTDEYERDEDERDDNESPDGDDFRKDEDATAPDSGNTENTGSREEESELSPLGGTYDITIWVSDFPGVVELTQAQIRRFMAAYPGITINATIVGVAEADAAHKVIANVASAPDIYCFAQDQLSRLVQAGALAQLSQSATDLMVASNDAGSVRAASLAGNMYAYPMTSDNGYFMYYDKSILSPEDAESLQAIVIACERNGVKFRFALENAWYTASFFFATGCRSDWNMELDGSFTAVNDTFNSDDGMTAMKGMQILTQSSCYDSNADIFRDAGVVITGIWNAYAAADHFGENLGATDLPSFTVDGMTYHLSSFTGNKLMGVKPQTDTNRAAVLSLLAQYLTNEECQMERYDQFQWAPSNKNAQASEAVQSNISLAALLKQNEYGIPQGQIHGSWWDIAKILGAESRTAASDTELQYALYNYSNAISSLFTMSDEQKNTWSVIGAICGTSWDTDFPMTQVNGNTWESDVFELHAGDEFRVRRGYSWDMNFGVDFNGANICVEADGYYIVRLVWNGGTDAAVTLIPVP